MGNGQAPGTATGLSVAGVETTATGLGAERSWEADIAVFFFAAFLIAGFLAGFFLAAAFFAGTLWLAPAFAAADFREAFCSGFFFRVTALPTTFFEATFFLLDFLAAFAIPSPRHR